jgi:hypothetical protein
MGRGLVAVSRVLGMNLSVLKKTRRRPQVGDVFAMLPPDNRFLYGRVIATDVNAGGFENSNLIYIYRARSIEKESIPELRKSDLLVPPLMTNNLPWIRGYFEVLVTKPVLREDKLESHCFRDVRGWYFDEYGERHAGPSAPVGQWGLHSFQTIDDLISEALGIALAPEELKKSGA